MNSSGGNTLKGENIGRVGRKEGNKFKKAVELIGEENIISLKNLQLDMAHNSPDEDIRKSCQQFLLDKVMPKATPLPPSTYIKLELIPMGSPENIKENEQRILNRICDGTLSLQEGDRLFAMTEQSRKTYEATEMARMIQEMNERMKENGI